MAVYIDDTTLRDGEQTAGVVFANEEKIEIAKMLDDIGVHQIEVGIPTMGGDEKEAIKTIVSLGLQSSLMAWNRPVIADIDASLECGVKAVALSISASDIHIKHKLEQTREWVLDSVRKATTYAKSHDLYVSVNAEDCTRADVYFLIQFAKVAQEAGADRLRICDTVGVLDPFRIYDLTRRVIEETGMTIEMHTHNDFGMATANALAGIKAGATYVNTTVNGLGERAGNACLAEVVMALKYIENIDVGIDATRLRPLSEYVAQATGRNIAVNSPIIGANVFAHESGIHAAGVIKYPGTYEAFPPEDVGGQRQLLIGKYSGAHSIEFKFKSEFGIDVDGDVTRKVLARARSMSVKHKRALFDKELMIIYQEVVGKDK